jgi:hypothetical protein
MYPFFWDVVRCRHIPKEFVAAFQTNALQHARITLRNIPEERVAIS